jgi:predicted small metal-binding protein
MLEYNWGVCPMQAVHCPCGATVEAETDDELVTNVEQHISEKHPDLVGKYSREQILAMAHAH